MRNYLIAGAVFVAGLVVFGLLLFRGLSGLGDVLQPVVVPGTHTVSLDEPGTYTVFYESRSLVGNQLFNTGEAIPALTIGLERLDTGEVVELDTSVTNSTFSLGSREGVSVLSFEIEAPGEYQLTVTRREVDGPEVVLSYGKGFHKRLMGTIFSSIAVMLLTVVMALGIAVFTFLKQMRARRLDREAGDAAPSTPA